MIAAVKVAIPWENMVSFPRLATARNIYSRGELVPYIGFALIAKKAVLLLAKYYAN